MTVASSSAPDAAVNIGVASHICAASPGGKRYDAAMTAEQRSSPDNGIWLCQNHAKEIDSDDKYTVDMLHGWRAQSERATVREIQTGNIVIPIEAALMLEDMDGNAIEIARPAQGADLPARAHDASLADIAKLKQLDSWPARAVSLTLTCKDDKGSYQITDLGSTIRATSELAIVSQPGTGKTTTLIQAAESILGEASEAIGFVRLGNWAHEGRGLVEAVVHREAFQGINETDLLSLAKQNRFTLLLDGWNELDRDARRRAVSEVERLRLDYPLLRIVISTRRQATELPISGVQFEVQPLSEEQQLEIARHVPKGDEVLDRAWRTKGVRDLVATPLYLQALLANAVDGALPTTKEEVLRLFVEGHERKRAHAEALNDVIEGKQRPILVALAATATPTGNTSISDDAARTVVSKAQKALTDNGILSIAVQAPNVVIDTLVDHHVIVRSGDGSIGFQHQQLQEWHASFSVEDALLASHGDKPSPELLTMLNSVAWEEPLLFACERVSRASPACEAAVAKAIVETLSIDPMLAAEMIYRSSEGVWQRVSGEVIAFAGRWHQVGKIDRAIRFVMLTGRPEFAEFVWPFLSLKDQQQHIRVLRHAPRVRTSILGPDAKERLAALPDDVRDDVLSEIASYGAMEGMELATESAIADTSQDIKNSVVTSLLFRRADRLAAKILAASGDDLWNRVAESGMSSYFTDEATAARMRTLRIALAKKETNKFRLLERLVKDNDEDAEIIQNVEQTAFDIMVDPHFPMDDGHAGWAVARAAERFPDSTRNALRKRFERGLSLPYKCDEMMGGGASIDTGPIPELVFTSEDHDRRAALAASLIGEATALRVMDRLFATFDDGVAPASEADPAKKAEFWALERRCALIPAAALAAVWLASCDRVEPKHYAFMADLWSGHGKEVGQKEPIGLPEGIRVRLSDLMTTWAEALLADENSRRNDFSKIAFALGRLRLPRDVPMLDRLLAEDLRRRARQLEEFLQSNGRIDRHHEARVVYGLQYRQSFALMKTRSAAEALAKYLVNPQMGKDAAFGLKDIQEEPRSKNENVWRGNEIGGDEVNDRRKAFLADQAADEPWEATVIFDTVASLIGPDTVEAQHRLALSIACPGTYMRHTRRPALIAQLLALPVPWSAKQEFMRAIAWSGEILSSDSLNAALDQLLERAKKDTWLLQNGQAHELHEWLSLYAFSDRPGALADAWLRLPKYTGDTQRLERMIVPLGRIDHPDAEAVLFELAERIPALLGNHAWVGAVLARGTESAVMRLLELAEREPKALGEHGGYHHERQLQEFFAGHPALRSALLVRYKVGEFRRLGGAVEKVLAQAADAATVLALIETMGASGATDFRALNGAVDAAVIERRPIGGNSYELHGVNAATLRKALFAMRGGPTGALAESCLTRIDKLRDQHGRVEFEPRHPDIESDEPWPSEANG